VIAALMVKDPDRRMALDEVRRRLRPLILDPDDPVYPGSPDAPTMAAPIAVPPQNGGASAASPARRPTPSATHRPPPTDSSPPSLVKSGQVESRPQAPQRGQGGARPATGTGGHAGPSGSPAESAPRTRPSAPAAAATPLAASPGPLPQGPRAPLAVSPGPLPPGLGSAGPPLAAGPGPLPPGLQARAGTAAPNREHGSQSAPTGWVAVGLVIAGAAVVLAGVATGWAITRAVAGESPWTTVSISTSESR
jgi:eukaryotic-like serine/threonine-protein kinase